MCGGDHLARKGRGAGLNPPNRFVSSHHQLELEQVQDDEEYLILRESDVLAILTRERAKARA